MLFRSEVIPLFSNERIKMAHRCTKMFDLCSFSKRVITFDQNNVSNQFRSNKDGIELFSMIVHTHKHSRSNTNYFRNLSLMMQFIRETIIIIIIIKIIIRRTSKIYWSSKDSNKLHFVCQSILVIFYIIIAHITMKIATSQQENRNSKFVNF